MVWRAGRASFEPLVPSGTPPYVIDSWLVENGRARAVERHRERFARGCEAMGASRAAAETFFDGAVGALPGYGRWFPRVALSGPPHALVFTLWLRPAPAVRGAARLWLAGADERRRPDVKGYDLGFLSDLGRRARAVGATEALLLDADGRALEGATTALLWWSGGVLCAPPAGPHLLTSTTREVLVALAEQIGQAVEYRDCRPAELEGCEVWLVNALHGIRPVTSWEAGPWRAGPAEHGPTWADLLAATSVALASAQRDVCQGLSSGNPLA